MLDWGLILGLCEKGSHSVLEVESGMSVSFLDWGLILAIREKGSHAVLGVDLGIRVILLDWGLILAILQFWVWDQGYQ